MGGWGEKNRPVLPTRLPAARAKGRRHSGMSEKSSISAPMVTYSTRRPCSRKNDSMFQVGQHHLFQAVEAPVQQVSLAPLGEVLPHAGGSAAAGILHVDHHQRGLRRIQPEVKFEPVAELPVRSPGHVLTSLPAGIA